MIKGLKDAANTLLSKSCTHNHSHEDIGRYKISKLLNQKENKTLNYDFRMGNDFLENLSEFDLVIRCESCTSGFAISSYFFSIKHTHSAVVYSQSHFATLEFLDIPDTRRTTSLYSFTSSVTASMCLESTIKMS